MSSLRERLRLDDPVAGRAFGEARVLEQCEVEPDQGRYAADLELLERAQHATPRVLAIASEHAQLRDHRVVHAADLAAFVDSRVDPHARPRRLAVARDPPGGGQEASSDVLRVDAAFDRVPLQADVLLAQP